MSIEQQISPFRICTYDAGTSSVLLDIDEYKLPIFLEFEEKGFCGNGYDWEVIIREFIAQKLPELEVDFDSEAGMFCAMTENEADAEKLAVALKEMAENDDLLRELLDQNEPE